MIRIEKKNTAGARDSQGLMSVGWAGEDCVEVALSRGLKQVTL